MKKRFLSMIMSALTLTLLAVPVSAHSEVVSETSETTYTVSADGGTVVELNEEDLAISEEVAGYVAEFFVRDMAASGETAWSDNTAIVGVDVMYDETGEEVTGYTVKMTTGYVVVSAYVDLSSPILEWSDTDVPVYEAETAEVEVEEDDKIIYVGALDYFVDHGEEELEMLNGDEIQREDLSNEFEEMRSLDNVEEEVLEAIVESKEEKPVGGISTFAVNRPGDYIDDACAYASYVYGGTFSTANYANHWESAIGSRKVATKTFNYGFSDHCAPTAIVNLVKANGWRYGNAGIKGATDGDIFGKVIEANGGNLGKRQAGSKYYKSPGGTTISNAKQLAKDTFSKYNVQATMGAVKAVNYANTVSTLTQSNRLMFIGVYADYANHPYGNHAMVGYAYSRLSNERNVYRAFIKVCDGHQLGARYVEIDAIAVKNADYFEVVF